LNRYIINWKRIFQNILSNYDHYRLVL